MKKIFLLLLILGLAQFVMADVLITELADPQNSSTAGRFVELYNNGETDVDFSTGWLIQRWTNGNADPSTPVALTGIIPAGAFYIVCNNASFFSTTYGFEADQSIGTGGPADSNGDDNVAIVNELGVVVDIFGVPGEDGSGTGHEFEDGRAERADFVIASNPVWDVAEWNVDNDSGGGDGPQYAPEDFDPGTWIGAGSTPETYDAYIVGDMNGWTPGDTEWGLTLNDNGVYELTRIVSEGTYGYKLIEGDTWDAENYPENNQPLNIMPDTEITFHANTTDNFVFVDYPVIVGDFIDQFEGVNWDPTDGMGTMFDEDGDDIYEWSGLITEGTWQTKITFNGNWDQDPCGGNIAFASDGVTETVIKYNFATNATIVEALAPATAPITFIVDDSNGQSNTAFYLKGTFNAETGNYDMGWNDGAETAMLDDGTNGDVTAGDHIFTTVIDLIADGGSNSWEWGVNDVDHQWIDGNWTFQILDETPQTLTYAVPFGIAQDVTVTFQVDMAAQLPVESVFLVGDFTNWSDAPIEMADADEDNIYTVDVLFPALSAYDHQFKFIKNGTDWEDIANRTFTIDDIEATQVLDAVYFNDEAPIPPTTQDVTVTFQVDMSQLNAAAYVNGVAVQGSVAPLDWSAGSITLADPETDAIYWVDVLFPAGSVRDVEFKFTRCDGDVAWNWENVDNRTFSIDDTNTEQIIDVVYWENAAPAPDVFFSEYIEGSSNNKALEIYNAGETAIDLAGLEIWRISNGGDWTEGAGNAVALEGTLEAGDVFVICNSSANAEIQAVSDVIGTSATYFNGDDAMALAFNGQILDVVGTEGADPGSGWEVAGVINGTANHTLVRKSNVLSGNIDWASAAGTSEVDSEWMVYAQDTIDNLGLHTVTSGNLAPIANAGDDVEVMADEAGLISVTLDGSSSYDPDGDAITYSWALNEIEVSTEASFATELEVGVYTFTLTVNDGELESTDEIIVTVIEFVDIIHFQDFQIDQGMWTTYSVASNEDWHLSHYGDAKFMKISGYGADVLCDDWMMSPAFNLDIYENEILTFETATNYDGPIVEVKISTDYAGDPTTATWTDITCTLADPGWAWTSSGEIDLSGYAGESVYIGFHYTSDEAGSATWELDNVQLTGNALSEICANPVFSPEGGLYLAPQEVSLTSETAGAGIYYTLDGSDPDVNSTLFEAPFTVSENTTVRAIALALGYLPSSVVATTYTFPTTYTITEIQGEADASPFAGEYVQTSGIITAVSGSNYWLQDGAGAWNGIMFYDSSNTPVVGDEITVVAEVTEYYDLTELINVQTYTVTSSGNALPEPVVISTLQCNDEAYESVLLTTSGTCDNADMGNGEWSIDDGTGVATIDDKMFAFTPVVGTGYNVTGVLTYSYGAFKLEPRDANDIVEMATPVPVIDVDVTSITQAGNGDAIFNISNVGEEGSVLNYAITSGYTMLSSIPQIKSMDRDRPTPHPVYANVLCYVPTVREEWLTITPISGDVAYGASDAITLSFDSTNLVAGFYTANIVIASDGGDDVVIPVEFTVEDGIPYPDAITYEAWILERPDEVLTETSTGCGYGDPLAGPGLLVVQCGTFASQWNEGETLHIRVQEVATGNIANAEIILTTAGFQMMDDIMVSPLPPVAPSIQIEVTQLEGGHVLRTLTWEAVESAMYYTVYACDTVNGEWVQINTEPITGTTFSSEGASAIKFYKVTASN